MAALYAMALADGMQLGPSCQGKESRPAGLNHTLRAAGGWLCEVQLCNIRTVQCQIRVSAFSAATKLGPWLVPRCNWRGKKGLEEQHLACVYGTFYIILYHFDIMVLSAGSWRDGPRLFKGLWHPALPGRMKTVHTAVYPWPCILLLG